MLRQRKRSLEPLRKIGARMKRSRHENEAVQLNGPVIIQTTESRNPEPTAINTTIRTPEYVPSGEFSSPEVEKKSPSVMSHAAIEIKTVDKLSHQTVSLILSERDKLRLAGIQR